MRPRFMTAIGALALLGMSLSACATAGGSGWAGGGYYPGYATGPSYYPGYYTGPAYRQRYYAGYPDHYYRAPPRRFERPEPRPAPRNEHWSQERLRHHWCSQPGAGCRG